MKRKHDDWERFYINTRTLRGQKIMTEPPYIICWLEKLFSWSPQWPKRLNEYLIVIGHKWNWMQNLYSVMDVFILTRDCLLHGQGRTSFFHVSLLCLLTRGNIILRIESKICAMTVAPVLWPTENTSQCPAERSQVRICCTACWLGGCEDKFKSRLKKKASSAWL